MGVAELQVLPRLVQDLLEPAAYPHPATDVRLIQTHISYVFLAGDYAYKVKKAIDLGFLDYSTLKRRAYFCRREVELNRRLCPDLYLGVAPISQTETGARIGREGETVDGEPVEWCVVMRRLPEDRLLSHLLETGEVTAAQIAAVARELATFHSQAATGGEIDQYGDPARIRVNADENFHQLQPYIDRTITADELARIQNYTDGFLAQNATLFARRIREGRIRDCHGDVHASSVCLTDDVLIFDGIEFNDRFRYGDVAGEVAFLAMDLVYYGRLDLAGTLVSAYRAASGDPLPADLLTFYACYRATVRAKVEGFKLDQDEVSAAEKLTAREAAQAYAKLADTFSSGIPRQFV